MISAFSPHTTQLPKVGDVKEEEENEKKEKISIWRPTVPPLGTMGRSKKTGEQIKQKWLVGNIFEMP